MKWQWPKKNYVKGGKKGKNHADFAKKVGMTANEFSRIHLGKVMPSVSEVELFCCVLDKQLPYFFGESQEALFVDVPETPAAKAIEWLIVNTKTGESSPASLSHRTGNIAVFCIDK